MDTLSQQGEGFVLLFITVQSFVGNEIPGHYNKHVYGFVIIISIWINVCSGSRLTEQLFLQVETITWTDSNCFQCNCYCGEFQLRKAHNYALQTKQYFSFPFIHTNSVCLLGNVHMFFLNKCPSVFWKSMGLN